MDDNPPSAPPSLRLTPDRRVGGVLVPVFALRTEQDLGIGDTASLREFTDWAADVGFRLVQILPINETGGDNSPYNAISSMALDPTTLHLRPGTPEELTRADHAAALAAVNTAKLRNGPVRYSLVKPLKADLLRRAFRRFEADHLGRGTARGEAFEQWVGKNGSWLPDYALFRVLMDQNGGTECWDRWPEEVQSAAKARAWMAAQPAEIGQKMAQAQRFHEYVQWIAYGQWEGVKQHAGERGVALMGDIPFGVSYYSADVWSRPEDFRLVWSGGAPPEPYFKDDPFTQKWGQNWGIPLYAWDRMRENDFAWWRQRVNGVREVFHVFRIDHILGFYRIYGFPWRPERNAEFLPLSPEQARAKTGGRLPGFQPRPDDSDEDMEANRREGEEYLRVVLEAAGDTVLVGEDLGTVPPYVRPSLTDLGIAGFKIPIWEPDPVREGVLLRPETYAPLSLATYGTHDHEPLAALWNAWEKTLAQQPHPANWNDVLAERDRLCEFAGLPGELRPGSFDPNKLAYLLEGLFRTGSSMAVVMITDLLGTADRFNVPGTATESNWSRRLPMTVHDLRADNALRDRTRGVLRRTGRA